MEKEQLLIAKLDEGERMMNQVAKEVHDNIGQLSHLLYMTLDGCAKAKGAQQLNILDNARKITDMIITNANHIGSSLNTDYIQKMGLYHMLFEDTNRINLLEIVKCQIEHIGEIRKLKPDTELLIYRVGQEAIHNSLEHAEAANINILLDYSADKFRMSIIDDGIGFNPVTQVKKGIGLSNMNERAVLLRAELTIDSIPNNGCRVILEMPAAN